LRWEIRSLRPCCDYADLSLKSQWQRHDGNVRISNRCPNQRWPFVRVVSQPIIEYLADIFWIGRKCSRLSGSNRLDWCLGERAAQPHIDEIQIEHSKERLQQSTDDLSRAAATPDDRERKHASQIDNAALKALDFVRRLLEWQFRVTSLSKYA
jgi:hypothetical protein